MSDLRTAAQQALEALQWHYRQGHSNTLGGFRLKIDEKALRELSAALAQQEEPVWMHPWPPVRAQQAEPVTEEVAALTAQRDALLEALKDATKTIEHLGYPLAAIERARAAIKAVEETK